MRPDGARLQALLLLHTDFPVEWLRFVERFDQAVLGAHTVYVSSIDGRHIVYRGLLGPKARAVFVEAGMAELHPDVEPAVARSAGNPYMRS